MSRSSGSTWKSEVDAKHAVKRCFRAGLVVNMAIFFLIVIEVLLDRDAVKYIHRDVEKHKGVQFFTDEEFSTLLVDYQERIQALKDGGYWAADKKRPTCAKNETLNYGLCRDIRCNLTTLDPRESLQSILGSMNDLDTDKLKEITRLLRTKHTHKKVLFLTAASSNHFHESQALIHNLSDNAFPYLTNYSFVYYDLGLTASERNKLEKYGSCEVRTFPKSAMPRGLEALQCYTWKPLIIYANLPTADMLVWMDASVRFSNGTVVEFLQNLEKKGLTINWDSSPIARHTAATMFDYFAEQPCVFSHIPEVAANFVSFKNIRFVREAIVKPWAACALSPKCMCPNNSRSLLACSGHHRMYHKCHRFDQSALGIILVKLFRSHVLSVKIRNGVMGLRRNNREYYFSYLEKIL